MIIAKDLDKNKKISIEMSFTLNEIHRISSRFLPNLESVIFVLIFKDPHWIFFHLYTVRCKYIVNYS